MKVEYVKTDTSHRIIEKAAWQSEGNSLILKVCKANDNSNEVNNGIPYMPLNDHELTAFRMFIQQIKFIGADVYCESSPGDIITIVADPHNPIYYNDSYVTAAQALTAIQQAMIDFANSMEFNGMFYYQSVLDVIRKTEHIVDISNDIKVFVQSYNTSDRRYDDPVELQNRMKLKSGYIRLLDSNSAITINSDNLTLVPASKMEQYFASLD